MPWLKYRPELLTDPKLAAAARVLWEDRRFVEQWTEPRNRKLSPRVQIRVAMLVIFDVWNAAREHGYFDRDDLVVDVSAQRQSSAREGYGTPTLSDHDGSPTGTDGSQMGTDGSRTVPKCSRQGTDSTISGPDGYRIGSSWLQMVTGVDSIGDALVTAGWLSIRQDGSLLFPNVRRWLGPMTGAERRKLQSEERSGREKAAPTSSVGRRRTAPRGADSQRQWAPNTRARGQREEVEVDDEHHPPTSLGDDVDGASPPTAVGRREEARILIDPHEIRDPETLAARMVGEGHAQPGDLAHVADLAEYAHAFGDQPAGLFVARLRRREWAPPGWRSEKLDPDHRPPRESTPASDALLVAAYGPDAVAERRKPDRPLPDSERQALLDGVRERLASRESRENGPRTDADG